MKNLSPTLVLDPMWLCLANHVDLEYYEYVLLDAKQKYSANLVNDFSNFYEIVFHYLNLNTIKTDKKLYDSYLNVVRSHKNLQMIVSQLSNKDDSKGKEIMKMSTSIFSEIMSAYLEKQINVLENLHFHFNNVEIHKEESIYIVCKSRSKDSYIMFKLTFTGLYKLGYKESEHIKISMPDLKDNEFRDQLVKKKPELIDFDSSKNVLVVSGTDKVELEDCLCLAKDTILLNKISNHNQNFDANVMLDWNRLIKKKQTIPYKLKG